MSARFSIGLLSVLTAVALTGMGCSKEEEHGHGGHAHEPKNGGVLVEVGRHQFNFEILSDASTGKLTVWVLDAHAENYVRIPAPTLQVSASVDGGEKVGDTSQFEGSAEWLKKGGGFSGMVKSVQLGGQSFGDVAFKYEPPTRAK